MYNNWPYFNTKPNKKSNILSPIINRNITMSVMILTNKSSQTEMILRFKFGSSSFLTVSGLNIGWMAP